MRSAWRARRLRLVARHWPRTSRCARDRGRLGPGQPGSRPESWSLVWRLQRKRHRPRVLTRRDARELHAEEERHGQPDALKTRAAHYCAARWSNDGRRWWLIWSIVRWPRVILPRVAALLPERRQSPPMSAMAQSRHGLMRCQCQLSLGRERSWISSDNRAYRAL